MPTYTIQYGMACSDPLVVNHDRIGSAQKNIDNGRALAAWIYHNLPGGTVDELILCCRNMATLRTMAESYLRQHAPVPIEEEEDEEEDMF